MREICHGTAGGVIEEVSGPAMKKTLDRSGSVGVRFVQSIAPMDGGAEWPPI
jgi:hypothetical protein